MSKELEYEINNFANLLHKDCMNLMECLKKQSEDNKPILYLGKHYEKVILPLEEYQKMCNRLEAIDNANPSEALNGLEFICKILNEKRIDVKWLFKKDYNTIKNALLKAQEDEKLKVDICEMFGLDNLFPYNDTKAILKELEEYMGRKNQLWVDFMKTSKKFKEQKKALEIIKEHIKFDDSGIETYTDDLKNLFTKFVIRLESKDTGATFHIHLDTEEEFELLKEVLE